VRNEKADQFPKKSDRRRSKKKWVFEKLKQINQKTQLYRYRKKKEKKGSTKKTQDFIDKLN